MTTTHDFKPDYATPPGCTLEDVLEERGMSQAELSRRTGLSTKHINQIVQGKASITIDAALRLERATGVPARIWNNLESRYQEHRLRLAEDEALEDQLHLLERIPTSSMVSLGLLSKRARPVDRLREVLAFFGVADSDAWDATWTRTVAAFRKSQSHQSDDNAVAVWLRMGELAASEVPCRPWQPHVFREVLLEARSLTREEDPRVWHPQLVSRCAQAGVALVVVREVKGALTHGVARWLGPDRALIQLSLRYRWSDIFWFSFFHEAKHVLDEAKRSIFVEQTDGADGTRADDEVAADTFAANFLIPRDEAAKLTSLRGQADVQRFAEALGIHPGIVVGRLHYEGRWPRSHGNGLRQRLVFTDYK